MRYRLAILFLGLALAAGLPAQESGHRDRMAGPTVERFFGDNGARVLLLGYRWTGLGASRNGLDAVLGVAPRPLLSRSLYVQADAAFARGVAIGPATLLLQGGVANVVELERTLEFYPGLQGGVALLVPLEARLAGRIDLTRRVYLDGNETYPFGSIGFSRPAFRVR